METGEEKLMKMEEKLARLDAEQNTHMEPPERRETDTGSTVQENYKSMKDQIAAMFESIGRPVEDEGQNGMGKGRLGSPMEVDQMYDDVAACAQPEASSRRLEVPTRLTCVVESELLLQKLVIYANEEKKKAPPPTELQREFVKIVDNLRAFMFDALMMSRNMYRSSFLLEGREWKFWVQDWTSIHTDLKYFNEILDGTVEEEYGYYAEDGYGEDEYAEDGENGYGNYGYGEDEYGNDGENGYGNYGYGENEYGNDGYAEDDERSST